VQLYPRDTDLKTYKGDDTFNKMAAILRKPRV